MQVACAFEGEDSRNSTVPNLTMVSNEKHVIFQIGLEKDSIVTLELQKGVKKTSRLLTRSTLAMVLELSKGNSIEVPA
jgi:hypothetical protein